eukprot:7316778-Prymnesium_polylepis.2
MMTLTPTPPVVTPYPQNTSMEFHDRYYTYTKAGTIEGAVPWNLNHTYGQIPIMLRDDPWNNYAYNPVTGKALFHWCVAPLLDEENVSTIIPAGSKSVADLCPASVVRQVLA